MKIFNYYITKNNPRDLLNQLREKEDIRNKAIEFCKKELKYSKNDCVLARKITCEKLLKILDKGE